MSGGLKPAGWTGREPRARKDLPRTVGEPLKEEASSPESG